MTDLGDPNISIIESKKAIVVFAVLGMSLIFFILGIIFKTPAVEIIFYITNLGIAFVTGQSVVDGMHKYAASKIDGPKQDPPQVDINKANVDVSGSSPKVDVHSEDKKDNQDIDKLKQRYEDK